MDESLPSPSPAEIERQLRKSAAAGDGPAALRAAQELLARLATSKVGADVDRGLMAISSTAGTLVDAGADARQLADQVTAIAEPWFEAPLDDFREVAEQSRQHALSALMISAARAHDTDAALAIFATMDAACERCFERWVREAIRTSPGSHALYPSAYCAANLVAVLVEQNVPVEPLLDKLEQLTSRFRNEPDSEVADAYADEEVTALGSVLAADIPAALRERCARRCAAIRAAATPPESWPRTVAALAGLS